MSAGNEDISCCVRFMVLRDLKSPSIEGESVLSSKPPVYERRLQIKHFFDDRQTGQTRRTWMEVQLTLPEKTTEGWVNDGKLRLSIGEERDVKGSFLLSIDEACRLIKSLEMTVEEHEDEKTKLWRE
jgi:hypothetical protein